MQRKQDNVVKCLERLIAAVARIRYKEKVDMAGAIKLAKNAVKEYNESIVDHIVMYWSIDDVYAQAETTGKEITEDQARSVLEHLEADDKNWDTVSEYIDVVLENEQ